MPRCLWPLAWFVLFLPSPRIKAFDWWRRFMLRLWGADVAGTARIYPSAFIEEPWQCSFYPGSLVGEGAMLLGRVTVCADAAVSQEARIADCELGPNSWVCAKAFVYSANVGAGAVVGACAVVLGSAVDPWAVVAGNPAKFIKTRELDPCESA